MSSFLSILKNSSCACCKDTGYCLENLMTLSSSLCRALFPPQPPSRSQLNGEKEQTQSGLMPRVPSTTTVRNTSTAEPGLSPWIWLGQAAIWMAKKRRDKEKSGTNQTQTQKRWSRRDRRVFTKTTATHGALLQLDKMCVKSFINLDLFLLSGLLFGGAVLLPWSTLSYPNEWNKSACLLC